MFVMARTFRRRVGMLVSLQVICLVAAAQPALALEEVLISYAGPSITFLPAEVARQRGFFREQNLDVKLLLTRTEVDRAALASGNIHYTLTRRVDIRLGGQRFAGAHRVSRHDQTVLGLGGAPGDQIGERAQGQMNGNIYRQRYGQHSELRRDMEQQCPCFADRQHGEL